MFDEVLDAVEGEDWDDNALADDPRILTRHRLFVEGRLHLDKLRAFWLYDLTLNQSGKNILIATVSVVARMCCWIGLSFLGTTP